MTEGPGRADDLQTAGEKDRYAKACLFVDNAGSDVVLGMLVLARELLKAGTRVVLAAKFTDPHLRHALLCMPSRANPRLPAPPAPSDGL